MSEAEKSDRLLGNIVAWSVSALLLLAVILLGAKCFQLTQEVSELRGAEPRKVVHIIYKYVPVAAQTEPKPLSDTLVPRAESVSVD